MVTVFFAYDKKVMVSRIKTSGGAHFKWCYVGKDVGRRNAVALMLSNGDRLSFAKDFITIQESLRDEYLDFVARLGRIQTDRLRWWASRFASKSPFQTDLFLLLCCKALVAKLIKTFKNIDQNLFIIIEDAWLFSDLKEIYEKRGGISFVGKEDVWLKKISLLLKGVAHRIFLIGWFIIAWTLILYYHGGRRPGVLNGDGKTVGIINPSEERTFKKGKYVDNFKPGLYEFYEKSGIRAFYIYPFLFPLSTAKHVGRNSDRVWPLILNINLFSILRRVFAVWRPKRDSDKDYFVCEYSVKRLVEREFFVEFASAGFNARLVLFDAINHFFKMGWCHSIVYVFENQPWEKMLCIACSDNGVKSIGYQHSSIWRLYLSQFAGKGEADIMPLPDKILTAGDRFAQLYKEGGIPKERVMVGGAWRYRHCQEETGNIITAIGKEARLPIILITLPIDIFIARSMLENIVKVNEKMNLVSHATLWIKPHPGYTKSDTSVVQSPSAAFPIMDKPFSELLSEVDIVVSAASTAGLEAFQCGKRVIAYIPENLLAADPLLDICDKSVIKWYEGEDIDLDFIRKENSSKADRIRCSYQKEFFGKVDEEIWLSLGRADVCIN